MSVFFWKLFDMGWNVGSCKLVIPCEVQVNVVHLLDLIGIYILMTASLISVVLRKKSCS